MPSTTFLDSSKEVAKKFINTVSYVDDLIYAKHRVSEEKTDTENGSAEKVILSPTRETVANTNASDKTVEENKGEKNLEYIQVPNIDPIQFTSSFINEGIHCSLIEIQEDESESSLEKLRKVLRKSDVVILDWQMHNDGGKKAENLLISLINTSKENGSELKLYIIYTEEKNYKEIIHDKIYPKLKDSFSIESVPEKDECRLIFGHTKIVVLNKSAKPREKYEVNESNLPNRIAEEFTEMTSGLLSNFALHSLTTIRENFHKILGLYSKQLDAAYLGHKVLLPHSEDSEHLLCELFKDSLGELLFYYKTGEFLSKKYVEQWVDNITEDGQELSIKSKDTTIVYRPTKKILKDILFSNEPDVDKKFETAFKPILDDKLKEFEKQSFSKLIPDESTVDKEIQAEIKAGLAEKKKRIKKEVLNKLKLNSTELFLNTNNNDQREDLDKSFARLTNHKNILLPHNLAPMMTLGTIIKNENSDDDTPALYFICIQQKCDSLRINKKEDRKFLFLPLEVVSKPSDQFNFIVSDGAKLKLKNKTFHLKTIKFKKPTKDIIEATKDGEKYYFEGFYEKERYEWICDLKDLPALRIAINYATQLSRVGLDESEWLRRNASS